MSGSFGEVSLDLFAFSARLLGWRPADFWAATPAELAAALAPPSAARESFSRSDLERLMERNND